MPNLCVFTTGTDYSLLRQSAESVMITLQTYDCHWVGYVTVKLREAVKFLQGVQEEYIMWVDAHDTLILKPEDEILARYHALGSPVVIAAEATCWPDADLSAKYPQAPSPRFLNAGGYIGNRHQLLTVLHTVLQNNPPGNEDDQRAWTSTFLAGMLPDVQIDHARRLFSCVGDGESALAADTCVMHWNGKLPGRQEYWEAMKKS